LSYQKKDGELKIRVKKVLLHPKFIEEYDFNIALIELEASLQLSSSIGFACLPKLNDAKLTFEDIKLLTR
jgi:hypothetical protein